jgi:ABC-type nickel/cobalt efflux system permease component RcnA
MTDSSGLLLVGAVAAVGVLHTIVPDHWVPITLVARQRGWSKVETARVALTAGAGHVLSTLAIALVIWIGGVAVATRFGHWVDTIASVALIGFGAWIAIGAWRDLHTVHGHSHDHGHGHSHSSHLQESGQVHGPELQKIATEHGAVELSIFESEAHGHEHPHPEKTKNRTALLLILGSSPMLEGIPAFFAAGKYGVELMPLERYGEVLSGGFIALVGLVFWIWPVL